MTTNGERSFPCLVFYAARPPEATCVLQETLTSDYVFTNPATASKQDMTNDSAERRCESLCDGTGVS